jgi:hypothetical protein
MKEKQIDAAKALAKVKKRRAIVNPNEVSALLAL